MATHHHIGLGATEIKVLVDQDQILRLVHSVSETVVAATTALEIARYELDRATRQFADRSQADMFR
jgi:hypothetical protein